MATVAYFTTQDGFPHPPMHYTGRSRECGTSCLLRRKYDRLRSWLKQYITGLQSRAKWQREKDNLKVGDLKHRNQWPLGRVGHVSYSRDGPVRSVRVTTATTEYVRPITKVVLLEAM